VFRISREFADCHGECDVHRSIGQCVLMGVAGHDGSVGSAAGDREGVGIDVDTDHRCSCFLQAVNEAAGAAPRIEDGLAGDGARGAQEQSVLDRRGVPTP
jgi:hypothetical protein